MKILEVLKKMINRLFSREKLPNLEETTVFYETREVKGGESREVELVGSTTSNQQSKEQSIENQPLSDKIETCPYCQSK